jgi:hypothetical protein
MTNRALPDEGEAVIAQFIRTDSVELGDGLDRPTLKSVVLMFIHLMVGEGFLDDSVLNFKCSNHFLSAFLQRQNLSFRRVTPAGRSQIGGQECDMFMIRLAKASMKCPESNIVNFNASN